MKLKTDLDFVEHYARLMKEDSRVFKQQKMLIESQMKSSKEVFKQRFDNGDFKKEARKYLKDVGLI